MSPLWSCCSLPLPTSHRGTKSALLPTGIPCPPSPCPSSLCTVPVPITQAATSSSIWACQPFLCLFTLPSRSRAASCHVFWATCILISASSNLSLLWAFSMSCLSANYLSLLPFLTLPLILGTCDFRVSCSQELASTGNMIQTAKPNCFSPSD